VTRGRWLAVAAACIALAVLVVVVRALAGTGGDPTAAAAPPAHDPPAAFAVSPGVQLPAAAAEDPLPVVLRGLDAVIGTGDGLQVFDTRSGETRRTVAALDDADGGAPASAPGPAVSWGVGSGSPSATPAVELTGSRPAVPTVVDVAGRPAVVAAFPVGVAGHGTTVGHPAVALLAVDAVTYAPVARVRIDLPPSLSDGDRLRDARVVGEDVGLLVVVAHRGADDAATTYAVDPVTGRIGWQRPGFEAAAVLAHRAIGVASVSAGAGGGASGGGGGDGVRPAALRAGDGTPAWTGTGPPARSVGLWAAGPALVAVTTTGAVDGARTLAMLDAATGATRASRPSDGGISCRYDERSTTVCAQDGSGQAWAAGFDAVTGRQLWELPDAAAGRVAPEVSTAWHGVVYGRTENGPVALDAGTGADRPVAPGAAPALVNAYVGITAATLTTPHAMAYQAIS